MDTITLINLILCLIILGMGILEYLRKRSKIELLIGLAFGLFGLSHIFTLLGMASSLTIVLAAIRILAYLCVIYALYFAIAKRN